MKLKVEIEVEGTLLENMQSEDGGKIGSAIGAIGMLFREAGQAKAKEYVESLKPKVEEEGGDEQ